MTHGRPLILASPAHAAFPRAAVPAQRAWLACETLTRLAGAGGGDTGCARALAMGGCARLCVVGMLWCKPNASPHGQSSACTGGGCGAAAGGRRKEQGRFQSLLALTHHFTFASCNNHGNEDRYTANKMDSKSGIRGQQFLPLLLSEGEAPQ